MTDLFGLESGPGGLVNLKKRRDPAPVGHAWKPGTGPKGETCRTCKYLARIHYAKTYLKCGKNQANWTHGRKSDVRARDAACKFWEPAA